MLASDWLKKAIENLELAGISTGRLDCLILLEDTTHKDRGWLLAHPGFELLETQVKTLRSQIKRRATHEPLAYIRGKTEFYRREFYVDRRVLEPRPESETMIELLLLKAQPSQKYSPFEDSSQTDQLIVDVGTGSGALAITAKLELPASEVWATDVDENCLNVARLNAKNLETNIKFFNGNLLEPISRLKYNTSKLVLICNLPYVPNDFHINQAAEAEPKLAIFGGSDGLNLYRKLFKQTKKLEHPPSFILTEAMPPQHEGLTRIARAAGFKLTKTDDFIQLFEEF